MMSWWKATPHMGHSTLLSGLEVKPGKSEDDGGEWEEICDDGYVEEKEGD